MKEHWKQGGKKGVFKDAVGFEGAVTITREKNRITVTCEQPQSKRYVKYLAKRFLKKFSLRDWLRVVSNTRDSYELRYFHIADEEEEEEEDKE